jgi:hypothetical protein
VNVALFLEGEEEAGRRTSRRSSRSTATDRGPRHSSSATGPCISRADADLFRRPRITDLEITL